MRQEKIKSLLPNVVQRTVHKGSVFDGLIGAMEQLHAPSEELLDKLHILFNPHSTPAKLLPMLAHWTDLLRLFQPENSGTETAHWQDKTLPTTEENLRNLIAQSTVLSKWRGTHLGLLKTLQIATGIKPFTINDGDTDSAGSKKKDFHIVVNVPAEASAYFELIERIVVQEKPAYTTHELRFMEKISSEKSTDGKSADK